MKPSLSPRMRAPLLALTLGALAWHATPLSAQSNEFTPGCNVRRPPSQAPLCVKQTVKLAGIAVTTAAPSTAIMSVFALPSEYACPANTVFSCTGTIYPTDQSGPRSVSYTYRKGGYVSTASGAPIKELKVDCDCLDTTLG